jgi:hypothetical protein
MRKGAPLLFALAALLGAAQAASASHCGFFRFSSCRDACCDAQNGFSSSQQQNRVCYKLVYDTVEQKRWHTCYKTVTEMCPKQVTRTCFKEVAETRYRDCHVTKYRQEIQECHRPVQRTLYKEVQEIQNRPVVEHCHKDVECVVRRCVPKHCEKDCHYTVCVPKYEQHCHVKRCQVEKQICEQHCHEVCQKVCRPVTEHCHREVCCQVRKCIEDPCMKQVCVRCCKDVVEKCCKNVTRRICEPCTTYKTVTRRTIECVDEPYDPCRGWGNGPFRGLLNRLHGNGCCNDGCKDACPKATTVCKDACPPAKSECCDPCFDPCACKTFHLRDRLRHRGNACPDDCKGAACGNACGNAKGNACGNGCGNARNACAPIPTTRKVWRVKCVTEQVACTTMVTRCVTEAVHYTVCKKVYYNEIRNVPYTNRRIAVGAYVDDKGVGHESDGPGRTFKEGAVARKNITHTVTRMVTTIEKKMVTTSVPRLARGAYVDEKGVGHGTEGPGRDGAGREGSGREGAGREGAGSEGPRRTFKEGATFNVANMYTTKTMVQEQRVRKIQYTVNEMVEEKQIKRVPYTVCKMVPHTVTKKVAYTVCEQEKYCKKVCVPYTECVKVPYTVRCKVPYTVVETVNCPVTRQEKVCTPYTEKVRVPRYVPVTVSVDPGRVRDPGCGNACPTSKCCETKCETTCKTTKCCDNACTTKGCGNAGCCETKCCFLDRLRQRRFASLCSTGCCEQTCKERCVPVRSKTTCCVTSCHDYCREGLLQRLCRNRFACEPCCDTGCTTTGTGTSSGGVRSTPMPPAEQNLPKSLPR